MFVSLAAAASAAGAQPARSGHIVSSLEIKILSTMLADEGFGEWGFAALVEVDGRRILFDTGAHEDTVQRNLKVLGLDLSDVDLVILSHNHADHTTGLLPLRKQVLAASPKALSKVYVAQGIFWPRIEANGTVDDRMSGVKRAFEATGGSFVEIAGPTEILPGVWLTGPVPRVHPERNWGTLGKVRRDGDGCRGHGARGHGADLPDRTGTRRAVRLRPRGRHQHARARAEDHRSEAGQGRHRRSALCS